MPPDLKAKWLAEVSWADVTTLNARLCEAREALHKPTSDGHDATRELWERSRLMDLSLEEAIVIEDQEWFSFSFLRSASTVARMASLAPLPEGPWTLAV